jgi:hypothetical protein
MGRGDSANALSATRCGRSFASALVVFGFVPGHGAAVIYRYADDAAWY